jgi:hypothetical protein
MRLPPFLVNPAIVIKLIITAPLLNVINPRLIVSSSFLCIKQLVNVIDVDDGDVDVLSTIYPLPSFSIIKSRYLNSTIYPFSVNFPLFFIIILEIVSAV